jgi:hypothetical protein
MKRFRVSRVVSSDGEIHLLIEDPQACENFECLANLSEIKKISKRDVDKKLLLSREV